MLPIKSRQPYLYYTGLILLVAGMPLSLFLTSLSQFFLVGSFLLEGNVREKFKRFFANKFAVAFAGIWLLHLVGLIWTSDLNEGFRDLRIKLPLLILPLMLAGSPPLPRKIRHLVLLVFTGAVVIGTFVSMAVLTGFIHRPVRDIRDVFIFNVSHIRFALFVCLSVFIIIRLAFVDYKAKELFIKISAVLLVVWLIAFLFIVESVTGLLILSAVTFFALLFRIITHGSLIQKGLLISGIIAFPIVVFIGLKSVIHDFYHRHPVVIHENEKTDLGNTYTFNKEDESVENGYRMWIYVSEDEMRSAWNQRSEFKYDSLDSRTQQMRFTLIRFLTSKGWRKDADAVNKLSTTEVHAIENGIANVNYQNLSNIRSRLIQIVWEFDQFSKGANPSGHSVTQRLEFWRAAKGIAMINFWIGVGTGDLRESFKKEYELMHSKLDTEHRLRAHNQYISIFVAFGIVGLLYFLFVLFFPVRFKFHQPLFMIYFLIALLSMITEDTLETQSGATFVAFFFCFLLFTSNDLMENRIESSPSLIKE